MSNKYPEEHHVLRSTLLSAGASFAFAIASYGYFQGDDNHFERSLEHPVSYHETGYVYAASGNLWGAIAILDGMKIVRRRRTSQLQSD